MTSVKLPVCDACDDTHLMLMGERVVPCTHCPVPCQGCRDGAFCQKTPCDCGCHRRTPPWVDDEPEKDRQDREWRRHTLSNDGEKPSPGDDY